MAKTFLPTLILQTRYLAMYITRYLPAIRDNLTPEQQVLVDELLEVCNALVMSIEIPVNP